MHALRRRGFTLVALVGVASVVALAGAGASGAVGRYTDPTGDAGGVADITGVSVSSDASGQIVFQVNTVGAPDEGDAYLMLFLDTDANPLTGRAGTAGADYLIVVDAESWGFGRWTGSEWDWDTPWSTARVGTGNTGATISVNKSELGNTQSLNFWVRTARDSLENANDDAPDDGGFNYTLAAGGPDIKEVAVVTTPQSGPRAGRTFTLKPTRLLLPFTGALLTSFPEPESYSCRARVGSKPLRGRGTGGCTLAVPKNAKGKRLTVTVTVNYQGAAKTVSLEYKVR